MADADYQTEQQIIKLAHEWLDAGRRRDGAGLDRILADDFLIAGWQPEGRLADKRFYIEDCLKPVDIQQGSYHFDRWKFRVYGGTAVVNCVLDIRAVVNGHAWGAEVLVSDVWVKEGDAWRAVARHTSPIVRAEGEKGEAWEARRRFAAAHGRSSSAQSNNGMQRTRNTAAFSISKARARR